MTRIRRAGRERITTAAALFALACAGCGDGPAGNTGSIQVAADPAVLSVPQGGSGSVTVTLTRGGGFGGPVTLAIAGLPAGATPTITPAQLSGTTTSASVDVTVGSAVPLGAYTATISATAQDVGQATATYQVTVTAAPYTLTVTPAAITIAGGESGSVTVNIVRTSFTGEVALALLNLPDDGVTGRFTPTPSTTATSELVVRVAADADIGPGDYELTIQGTAAGPIVQTTTLTVTVPGPSPSGGATRNARLEFHQGGRAVGR
jgi:hypothetical protein